MLKIQNKNKCKYYKCETKTENIENTQVQVVSIEMEAEVMFQVDSLSSQQSAESCRPELLTKLPT